KKLSGSVVTTSCRVIHKNCKPYLSWTDMLMLDLLLLRSFVAVIDENSFTRAANRLHLTQPAISGHLRRLEAQVGKPLLRRTTRAFEVTPDGECLAAYARAILALNRDAMTQLSRSSYQGNVRLGVAEDCVTVPL